MNVLDKRDGVGYHYVRNAESAERASISFETFSIQKRTHLHDLT